MFPSTTNAGARMAHKVEIMSPVDVAWLSMDEPTNLMMVNGILTFDRPLDVDRFRRVIEYRWLRYERFKLRVVQPRLPITRPYWESDHNFNLDNHIHRVALPKPGDQATLQDMVSDLMSQPLDFSRPPWHFYIIENFGDGCALMARIHHCVADGMALVGVLLSMTDFRADAPLLPMDEVIGALPEDGLIGGMTREAANTATTLRNTADWAIHETREAIQDGKRARRLVERGAGFGIAATRLLARSNDPSTRLKGSLGVMKRAAWSAPTPLSEVKLVKNILGGTINDVIITAVAGGLRRYLIAHGDDVDNLEFRAAVPVNLRNGQDGGKLGNKFGLVFLCLPIHIGEPLIRLVEVRRRMAELKRSAEAPVTLGILGMMGVGNDLFREFVVQTLEPKATVVLTNVPGPPVPLYMAGEEIKDIMFWVPQAGRLGVGISILSYANRLYIGVATDAGLVPEPVGILDGFHIELEQLKNVALAVKSTGGYQAR
jgi:diacylglycerol O-acyltransferase / wax synthase